MPTSILAYSDYIVASGENIGIELNSKGIVIVGLYKVKDEYPASLSGLKIGDIIISVNDEPVSNIDEMINKINESQNKDDIKIEYLRNEKKNVASLKLIPDEAGVYKTGLYVKDSIAGIGTLTFIDPQTKLFGALGHEILEKTTGEMLEIKDGTIFASVVTGIIPSNNGTPGEKRATFYNDKIKGTVFENTNKGIFGTFSSTFDNSKLYKVATPSDIKTGEAKIKTVLDGDKIKEYSINILKINNRGKTKNLVFEITDDELLSKTGGIIQGMSGSPIIQGEFIIGAVTHVVVDNPKQGYGIFVTNMLEEAEN